MSQLSSYTHLIDLRENRQVIQTSFCYLNKYEVNFHIRAYCLFMSVLMHVLVTLCVCQHLCYCVLLNYSVWNFIKQRLISLFSNTIVSLDLSQTQKHTLTHHIWLLTESWLPAPQTWLCVLLLLALTLLQFPVLTVGTTLTVQSRSFFQENILCPFTVGWYRFLLMHG